MAQSSQRRATTAAITVLRLAFLFLRLPESPLAADLLRRFVLKAISYIASKYRQEFECTTPSVSLRVIATISEYLLTSAASGEEETIDRRVIVDDEVAFGCVSVPAEPPFLPVMARKVRS